MYAEKTTVPVEKTRGEIERLLQKHGATSYLTAVDHEIHEALVRFKMNNRIIRFQIELPLPPTKDRTQAAMKRFDQQMRQRWRALLLVLKAKLEAIQNNISTFDSEFLAHIVVPGTGDQTVAEFMVPQIEEAYKNGYGMLMLPAGRGNDN